MSELNYMILFFMGIYGFHILIKEIKKR